MINFSYSNVTNKLNNIFYNLNDNIKKTIENTKQIKIRNRETSFIDALLYKFEYSKVNKTKQNIVSELNIKNNKNTFANSFFYRENQIPVLVYENIYKNISDLYKTLKNIDPNEQIKVAVDGTFNNTNLNNNKKLETSLNMGFYDITNDIPIDLTFEGVNKKNNELQTLIEYLKEKKITEKTVLILDRIYCKYEFVDYLIKNNYNFVLRFRNNCKNFKNIKNIKNVRILKFFEDNTTHIAKEEYDKYIDKEIEKKRKKKASRNVKINIEENEEIKIKEFKSIDLTMKYEYTLLTNLNEKIYNDKQIRKIYKERWNVEIFFKLLKYNFKFEHLCEHNKNNSSEQYKKLYYVNLIMIYLEKILEKVYEHNNDFCNNKKIIVFKKDNDNKYIKKINKSLAIKGFYHLLPSLFNGKMTIKELINISNNYIKYSYIKKGINKERKAKTPFFKWYVKGYSNRALLYKIIQAKLTNNISKLNDNHIVLYNICTLKLNS